MMASMGFVVAVQLQLMANEQVAEPSATSKIDGADAPIELPPGSEHTDSTKTTKIQITLNPKSFDVRSAQKSTKAGWAMFAGVGPAFGFGLAPAPLVQGRAFFDIRREWVGFELGGEVTLPVTKRYTSNGGFQQQLRVGTIAACAWHGPLAICSVTKLGRMQVQGIDLDVPASPAGFIAQTGPRLVYTIELGDHLVFLGHIETMGLLTAWTVETNQIAVWKMPRFSFVAGIGVAVRF
jgi:hypothetical protein